MSNSFNVTVWGEFRHEKKSAQVAAIYPQGMHEAIAAFLRKEPSVEVRTATLDEPEHGLSDVRSGQDGCARVVGAYGTWRRRG